ncbi:MAG: glutamine--fructose-6-phosphate transaminase (isomerizing) [Dehalococcoidia bacterium]
MCGIIGYIGTREAEPICSAGLEQLEYRGYDSAGVAVLDGADVQVRKRAGKLAVLAEDCAETPIHGTCGMGHTRWATHGSVTDTNAHPHRDCQGDLAVIHNGIVENYAELRQRLIAAGHTFLSQTDTEVIAHLMEDHRRDGADLLTALRLAGAELKGANAVVAMARSEPRVLVSARLGNAGGVVIGYGHGEMLLASDLPALLPHTRRVAFLHDREYVRLDESGARYVDATGAEVAKEVQAVPYDEWRAQKGTYRHFYEKEIHDQPDALIATIRPYISLAPPRVELEDVPLTPAQARRFDRVLLMGMGTSEHAAMLGRAYIETIARVPAWVEESSEFRYADPVVGPETLVISVAQSGETADTLEAMAEAKKRGATVLTVCNTPGAASTRLAHGVIYIYCGPERAVAASKTFVASVAALYLFACWFGHVRGVVDDERLGALLADLARLPDLVGRALSETAPVKDLARRLSAHRSALFLGRGLELPVALEGALKLKELSYIHAEGYPAGKLKHGPLALIDRDMPTSALAPRDHLFDKMVNSIQEVRAREGYVVAVGSEGDERLKAVADLVLPIPANTPELLQPIVAVAPLQVLAYEIAVWLGKDVDQPRNLAKTVTVE